MAAIYDSVLSTETLLEVKNNEVTKFAVGGDGSIKPSGNLKDSNSLSRFILAPAKTIVDGAATTLFTVPIAAGSAIGGTLHFSVFASDGTDHQTISGIATFASVNKAGTLTSTITYVTSNEAKAVSAGTLTLAFTMAEDTADIVSVKLQPTGSLTETTYTVVFTVVPLRGEVTLA